MLERAVGEQLPSAPEAGRCQRHRNRSLSERAWPVAFVVAAAGGAGALAAGPLTTFQPESMSPPAQESAVVLVQAQAELTDFTAEDISGAPGEPIPVKIALGSNDQNAGQLFLFTGIPEGVKLSPGGYFGDFWAVTAKDLPALTLTAPDNFSGTFQVKITRTRSQSISARSATIMVTIGEGAGAAATTTAATKSTPAAEPDLNERMLLGRGTELFKKGDVAGARVIFEYLAAKGSAQGAIAMGETYDPLVLDKLFIKGLDPDAEKAQAWYQKAEELGSGEARSRLNALATR